MLKVKKYLAPPPKVYGEKRNSLSTQPGFLDVKSR